MAVQQCEHFCDNLRLVHERTVIRIEKYLVSASTNVDLPYVNRQLSTRGVVYRPNKENKSSVT